eukprot:CAMPEP_0181183056 /NCGR_PEP_ID=MMETSP1096-20121128/8219_1 /TAXON_ID=156174 ORGANISM="Chrysochromulina ericina, Strain CCMP281" /NCGR_SAMPLE_ID=MMETSP1096 /ASSEMBLY_ACC=CAM_ASM_000453 /LENGTH=287 /DNA_ID=CAMNT_0023271705 /DNA_START=703 /DNA_END=1568 /DNA_ORIENTATION=-
MRSVLRARRTPAQHLCSIVEHCSTALIRCSRQKERFRSPTFSSLSNRSDSASPTLATVFAENDMLLLFFRFLLLCSLAGALLLLPHPTHLPLKLTAQATTSCALGVHASTRELSRRPRKPEESFEENLVMVPFQRLQARMRSATYWRASVGCPSFRNYRPFQRSEILTLQPLQPRMEARHGGVLLQGAPPVAGIALLMVRCRILCSTLSIRLTFFCQLCHPVSQHREVSEALFEISVHEHVGFRKRQRNDARRSPRSRDEDSNLPETSSPRERGDGDALDGYAQPAL